MRWVEKDIKYYDLPQSAYIADTDEEFEQFIQNANTLGYQNITATNYSSWIGLTYHGSKHISNKMLTIADIHNLVKDECIQLGINRLSIGIVDDGVLLSFNVRIVDSYCFKNSLFKENNVKYEDKRCLCRC